MSGNSGMILDETARIPSLEDGTKYKFLEVLESVMQEDKLVLELISNSQGVPPTDVCHLDKSFVRPQSCNRLKPVCLGYLMWTQQWSIIGRLLLRTGEGTPVARLRYFTYREIRGAEVYVR